MKKNSVIALVRLGLIALFLMFVSVLSAQTALDAFRYAFVNYDGTARYSATAGAFSSLGGDITVASSNPAGLGIMRRSVVSFTPGLSINKQTGDGYSDKTTDFIFPSFGLVFAFPNVESGSLKGVTAGFSYSQGANFEMESFFSEHGAEYTKLYDIAESINQINVDNPNNQILPAELEGYGDFPTEAQMAYAVGLIDPGAIDQGIQYYEPNIFAEERVSVEEALDRKGQHGEYAFSFAANFSHKLYIGATLGLQSLYMKRKMSYDEVVENPVKNNIVKSFYTDEYLETSGAGVNLKLGAIYRFSQAFRLGIAVHTPSYYNIEEEYYYEMGSSLSDGKNYDISNPNNGENGISEFQFYTPWRFSVGASYLFEKRGFLSFEYERVDYSTMEYSGDNFKDVNSIISNLYTAVNTIKVGGEVKLVPQLFLRAGYSNTSNIYADNTDRELKFWQYSGGFGYRINNFSIDLSYQYLVQDYNIMKNINENRTYNIEKKDISSVFKLTFGFRF